MITRSAACLVLGFTLAATPLAQSGKPAPSRPPVVDAEQVAPKPSQPPIVGAEQVTPQPGVPRREPGQPVNVRIELTLIDQSGPGEPSRKVVTMLVADRHQSNIRTSGWIQTLQGRREVSINVDANPMVLKDGVVKVDFGLQYQPAGAAGTPVRAADISSAQAPPESSQTTLIERISTILESGKPLVISQAADPASDRRITIEAKATIVK
jgi:hypothetical protein